MGRSALQYLMVGLALLLISTQGHAAFWGQNSSEPTGKDKVYPQKVIRFNNLSSHKDSKAKYQPDKILVKYKPGVPEAAKEKQHKKHGSTRIKALKPLNVHHLKLKKGLSVEKAVKLYQADPNVAYAEPDYLVSAAAITPNDTYYSTSGSWAQPYQDMWGLHKIKSGEAWETTQGSSEVVVAVSDTGLDLNHPDIQANLWTNPSESTYNGIDDDGNSFVDDRHGWNFFSGNNNPNDDHGHGTHVSGTIAAATNNGIGVAGISWNAKIMALKFLNSSGSASTADGAATIIYAADNGAKVVNCSWGGGGRSQTLEDAINYAFSRGTMVVAAAGNSASDAGTFFPAGYENVITVAATDSNDVKASFSNYGNAVEVSAPGVDILSLRSGTTDMYGTGTQIVGANYYRANGTSMAAPHVSGLAALLFSQYPAWSNKQVMAQIVGSTDDIGNPSIGSGRINALSALSQSASRLRMGYLGRSLDDQSGNGNGMLDAGENINVVVSIKNYAAAANATVTLTSTDPYVTVVNGSAALGTVGPWDSASNSGAPFVISVSPDAPQLHNVSFTVTISGDNGSYTNSTSFEERVSPFLPGWPVQIGQGPSRPVVLADMDGDGVDEVITYSDKIYVVKGDGTSLPGWPRVIPADSWDAPLSVGDLNGDGSAEIVLAGYENVYAWNRDGTFSKGFPIRVPTQVSASSGEILYPALLNTTLADFDGDGYLEIASASFWQGKVYLWSHDGMLMPGWPIAIESASSFSLPITLAAGDLDGDGRPELVVPVQERKVYAWHHDGTAAAGWPVLLPNSSPMSVTLADTGNDGKANVFVCTGWELHGFYGNGSPMPGWPQMGNLPAIGDINGDGELDIVSDGWGEVLAYSKDGTMLPGWPQPHLSNTLDSPSLADVDGDGGVDVLVRTMGGIYGWHGDGTALAEFPIASTDQNQIGGDYPVALGDINGDGRTDLVTGSGLQDSRIHAYQMSGQYLPQLAPWPMSQHDAQGTTTLIHTPVIISSALSGVLGVPFSQRLEAKGGYAPYSWKLAGGALPPGLSLDGNTGEIYGTPSETGTFGCTVRLFDANGATVSKPVSIEIQLVAITTTLGYGTLGTPYSQSLAAAGGTAPYGWAVVAGAFPPGLALNPATGGIAGVPTASGSYGVTVQVTDAQGVQAAREYSITVYQWADKSLPGRYASDIAVDDTGNLYVTGIRYTGVYTAFASKYGPAGNLIWERELSGTYAGYIAPDAAGNAYVAGSDGQAFLSKYDTEGNRLWIRYHDNGVPQSLGVDASGNAYVAGRPYGGTATNFLIKYDAAGGVLWEKVPLYSGSGGMAFDAAGNLYCNFGGQVVKYDQFGNQLWDRGYSCGAGSIALDQNNNVTLLADNTLSKHDPAGNALWYYVTEGMQPSRAAWDGSGNIYVTGFSLDGSAVDMVTRKYDPTGALIWSKSYDTGFDEFGMAVAADRGGQGVYVAGTINGGDMFIQRYVQPTITTTALPDGTVEQPYSFVLGASSGATPYTWSALPGTLPAGLSLDGVTGVISGAPLSSGVYPVSVRAAGSVGLSDLKTFVLTVHPSPTASPAEFSATPLVGEAPLLVNFTDASGNSPIAWSWLLGDGATANEQNPSHLYLTPGSYSVSLTAVGATGFESVTKPGYITVLACTRPAVRLMGGGPQASFSDINEAYDTAMDYDLIQLMAVEQAGALLFNRNVYVTLSGGYDCRYGANPGKTALTGSLRVTGGTVALDNVRFK